MFKFGNGFTTSNKPGYCDWLLGRNLYRKLYNVLNLILLGFMNTCIGKINWWIHVILWMCRYLFWYFIYYFFILFFYLSEVNASTSFQNVRELTILPSTILTPRQKLGVKLDIPTSVNITHNDWSSFCWTLLAYFEWFQLVQVGDWGIILCLTKRAKQILSSCKAAASPWFLVHSEGKMYTIIYLYTGWINPNYNRKMM